MHSQSRRPRFSLAGRLLTVTALGVVAVPLFYVHIVGRRDHVHSDLGWTSYVRLYGWPCLHGSRFVVERWFTELGSEVRRPLEDFSVRAVAVNGSVSVAMLVGAVYVIGRLRSAIHKLQFSLGSVLILFVVAGGLCCFIKYDRNIDAYYDWETAVVALGSGAHVPPPVPPITDSPPYMYVPILLGMAAGMYTACVAVTVALSLIVRLVRRRIDVERF
jgi:hypothetical protein